jgi:hypothetical protein
MDQKTSTFVSFQYVPVPNSEAAIALLVLADVSRIEVVIQPGWEANLDPNDREYLTELIADWRSANAADIPALLRQLAELSVGPLRAVESGVTDAEGRMALVQKVNGSQPTD